MFKKRTIKAPTRKRETSDEPEVGDSSAENRADRSDEDPPLEDLIALRKLRKAKQGIDSTKLTQGGSKKKRRAPEEEEDEQQYGLQKPNAQQNVEPEDEADPEDEEAKTRKLIRANHFTQQTNKLDVDKHMMAYIEENMRAIRGESSQAKGVQEASYDPHAQLYQVDERYKVGKTVLEEGNVTNSMAMLTAIPEVDLGIDIRLRNIEETEKAKRVVEEEKRHRREHHEDDEGHLAATRFYRPRQQVTSDADALRNAKLEAMGIEPPEPRRRAERKEVATDDVVMERFKKRMRR